MQYKYPEGNPPYTWLIATTVICMPITYLDYQGGKAAWYFPLAIVSFLWLWVGLVCFFRAKQNKRNSKS